jgi:hypothetical protein
MSGGPIDDELGELLIVLCLGIYLSAAVTHNKLLTWGWLKAPASRGLVFPLLCSADLIATAFFAETGFGENPFLTQFNFGDLADARVACRRRVASAISAAAEWPE